MICYLLSPRGYCTGVKRAVDMVTQILKLYKTVYIVEDIIHNKVLMNKLLSNGIIKVDSIDEIPDGSAVMFSAHGVSPQMVKQAEKKELTIIDSTCPVVKDLQNKVKEKSDNGYSIIIIGNRAHQEVVALLGYANNDNVYVVNNEMDIDLLPDLTGKKVAYFTQTSMYPDDIQPIIDSLKAKIPNIESNSIHNICEATLERQAVIKAIAPSIDLLLVVGSSYSSNTMSLVRAGIASGIGQVMRIDSEDELNLDLFKDTENIAITGATSTPEDIINEVIDYLKNNLEITVQEFPSSNPIEESINADEQGS